MAHKVISFAVLAASVATATAPSVAMAQEYYGRDRASYHEAQYRDERGYDWDRYDRDRRDGYYAQNGYRGDRAYHGRSRYYRERCDGGDGAVGTVAGGAGGAVLGSVFGGGVLGTVLGGVGGALLGRHLDKEHTKDRYGC